MNYNVMLSVIVCHNTPLLCKIRVPRKQAQTWLMENKSIIFGGNVYYLQIKDIGLGICEVALRAIGKKNTYVVASFEELVINNTRGEFPHIVV